MKHLRFLLIPFIMSTGLHAQVVTSSHKSPIVRSVPDTVVDRMKNEKDFVYANDMSYWKEEPPPEETTFDRFRINPRIDPKKFEVRK